MGIAENAVSRIEAIFIVNLYKLNVSHTPAITSLK